MNQDRRNFIKQSLKASGMLISAPVLSSFNIFSNISETGTFMPLRKNVGYFTGRGGTIGWLMNEEGIVVVDAQFPASAQQAIAKMNRYASAPFSTLINTHHHGDHTGGNIAFKGLVKQVVAHENCKINQMKAATERGAEAEQLYADKTFSSSWHMSLGSEKIACFYKGAAHTNGDIITHFENANIVHMGDLVFNRRFPYIDKSAGAMVGNWIKVLDFTLDYFDKDTLFIFGHSGENHDIIGNKADVLAFQNYLEKLLEFVQQAVSEGKSLDEIKSETQNIPGAEEWQGSGISRSLEAAYSEITGN